MSRRKADRPADQFSSDDFDEQAEATDVAAERMPTPDPKASVSELGAGQAQPAKPHTIEVWCGEISLTAYVASHVETRLYGREGEALKRLAVGLNQRNERLEDGTHVNSQPTAIRWLLQRLAEEFMGPLPE